MNLELYQYLQQEFAKYAGDLNVREETTQKRIEAYDPEIFESGLALRLNGYLTDYNRYRQKSGWAPLKLRYYQILALYYTELYF